LFKPEDFKDLAVELKEKKNIFESNEKALSRTSISRFYYFLFLECREIIIDKLSFENKKIFISEKCKSKHHYIVQKILYKLAKFVRNKNINILANLLNDFRVKRNEADYNLELDITFEDFDHIAEYEKYIELYIEELKKIPKEKFDKVFKSILNRCK